jgi:tetratricopeptide (TPR) repeat protein
MFKLIIISLIITIHDSSSFAQISHQSVSNSIAENELAKAAMLAKNDIKAYKHLQQATNLDPSNSSFINSAAYMAMKLGEFKSSLNYLQKALYIDIEKFGINHPNVAAIHNNMGNVYSVLENRKSALHHFDAAYKIISEYLGEKHPQTINIKKNLDREVEKIS